MNQRKLNDKIRNKVSEITSEQKAKRIRYFVDKRVHGRRKIFKSYGSSEWIAVWEKILKEMDLEVCKKTKFFTISGLNIFIMVIRQVISN